MQKNFLQMRSIRIKLPFSINNSTFPFKCISIPSNTLSIFNFPNGLQNCSVL